MNTFVKRVTFQQHEWHFSWVRHRRRQREWRSWGCRRTNVSTVGGQILSETLHRAAQRRCKLELHYRLQTDIKISSIDANYFFLCFCSLQTAVCSNGWNSGTLLCLEEKGSPALFGLTDKLLTRTRPNQVKQVRTQIVSRLKLRWLRSC